MTGRSQTDELRVATADGSCPPRRLTDGNGLWPPRAISDDTGGFDSPRWLDQDTVIWHREGHGFVTVSLGATDIIVTPAPPVA